jgi:L-aminopeptidase/D-esterase-like protein
MQGLTDIPGILVGHVSDYEALTGCTVILCESGAVCGADIRGSATGTSELDLASPFHLTTHVHGICLAGGSAFGLEAASGVRRYLEARKVGFPTGHAVVPLVPSAILYDLRLGRADVRPTREMGEAAAKVASPVRVSEGSVGAGTGALIGTLKGTEHAMKGGVGTFTVTLPNGVKVSALAVTNCFGDVIDPRTGAIVAGCRKSHEGRDFAGTAELVKALPVHVFGGGNTTLVVVATDAELDKVQANKLAQLAQHGVTRTISPVHTMVDGDIVFTLSAGFRQASLTALGVAAAEAVSEAILRAARASWTLGGVPGLGRRPD